MPVDVALAAALAKAFPILSEVKLGALLAPPMDKKAQEEATSLVLALDAATCPALALALNTTVCPALALALNATTRRWGGQTRGCPLLWMSLRNLVVAMISARVREGFESRAVTVGCVDEPALLIVG